LLLAFACKAAPVLLLSASPACVIPVVPEFKDPPEAKNRPPQIVTVNPALGDTVTRRDPTFTIKFNDPNGDKLFVRWIADYPPFGPNRRFITGILEFPPSADGTPLDAQSSVGVSCGEPGLVSTISLHKIMAIVADRPFVSTSMTNDLMKATDDGLTVSAWWLFAADCPP